MGFCTVEDVENLLQIEIEADDASCLRAIEEATEAIKNYCHQEIEQVTDDEYTFDVPGFYHKKLFLPELPVTDVKSVVEDGEALDEGDDEDYQLGRDGVLHRIDDYWEKGVQIVTVTYTHGYTTLPDDVVAVCTRAAARVYQAGLRASEAEGVPGVASKSLGDFSVSYTSGGGGVGEGVMGVSGSRMLLLSEKDMLDRYRYVAQ
ncbi:MAG: phage head-tail connector protein [Anaerolineae bacterium]